MSAILSNEFTFKRCRLILFLFVLVVHAIDGQRIWFQQEKASDSIYLNLINEFYGPAYVRFSSNDKFSAQLRLPDEVVIPPRDSIAHLVAIPTKVITGDSLEWKEYFKIKANLGDPYNSDHTEGYLYSLPFPKGKTYRIMQTWNGRFSHRSHESKYAVDFDMAIGDTVCAARSGIVVRIEGQFTENGDRAFRDKANQVVILHADGTLAFYVHLKHNGAIVVPGMKVAEGQPIGLSGNTGFSSRPHLHFVVREAPDKAIPVYFKGYSGKRLRKNKFYLNRF